MAESAGSPEGTTPLNKVLASILRDVDKAQNTSNIYSAKLSRYYKNNKTLAYFPVPNGCIEQVEMDLKLAIDGVALPGPTAEEQLECAIDIFKKVSSFLSEDVGTLLNAHLKSEGTEEAQVQAREALNATSGDAFKQKLKAKLFGGLTAQLETLVSAENGLNYGATIDLLMEKLQDAVLSPEVVKAVIPREGEAKERLQQDLNELTNDALKKAAGAVGVFELWDSPNLDVVVDTNALVDVPEYLITTLNVKVSQRNYKWVLNSTFDGANDEDPGVAGVLEPVNNG